MKELRILMLNGSPRANGNTSIALREMEKIFTESGVAVETVQVGNQAVRGCVACNGCAKLGKCVFDDVVNELAPKFEQADGLVVASPVYYASANATLVACLDRPPKRATPALSISGTSAANSSGGQLYTASPFTISGMPVASSQYWNSIHGRAAGEAEQDGEGLQTMRVLARNMTFLMRCIALGREQFGLPEKEARIATHFIR